MCIPCDNIGPSRGMNLCPLLEDIVTCGLQIVISALRHSCIGHIVTMHALRPHVSHLLARIPQVGLTSCVLLIDLAESDLQESAD